MLFRSEYDLPGNNTVDLVSTIPFSQLNGTPVSEFTGIDGVTSVDGLTVMFYNTGDPSESGFTSNFFSYTPFDYNNNLVSLKTITITNTNSTGNLITCNSTAELVEGNAIYFTGTGFGNVQPYSSSVGGTLYFVKTIVNGTQFTISSTVNGSAVTLTTASGSMTGTINQGLLEEGYYSTVNNYFYRITYVGDPSSPVISLAPDTSIPINEKITANYGTQFINRSFFKNDVGTIEIIPFLSAPLDTLYYQDGSNSNKVGIIKLVESNLKNRIDVDADILGHTTYTSTSGIVFTNGLKVTFQGDVVPEKYKTGQYYVEGVGTAIELLPVSEMIVPEAFSESVYIPWDTTAWDIGNWEANSNISVTPDYITIARNSINKNAWSRSNRWFHIDVIKATAEYNNDPSYVTTFAVPENKAKRPIIEFYPNLRLFNSGSKGKAPIDFIDFRTTDAFSYVAGQQNYYPDVEVYTTYNATIAAASSSTTTTITIPTSGITGTFGVDQYIADSTNALPINTYITDVSVVGSNTVLTVEWEFNVSFSAQTNSSIIATNTTVDNYALFDGARVVFAQDNDENVRNKIYVARFNTVTDSDTPIITLTEAEDGLVYPDEQTVVYRGYNYSSLDFYFDGVDWIEGQQKITVNQPPLFDVFDANGISFGNSDIYVGTSFKGNKLFAYGLGSGINDSILGFPLRYSSVDNVGDISFDVSLNKDTFDYVQGTNPKTQKVNTGYVYNYASRTEYIRELGWKTAVAPSTQYQLFSFDYTAGIDIPFICDIAATDLTTWPNVQVFINNVLQTTDSYELAVGATTTTVYLNTFPEIDTVIQILILSDQVSKTAYYTIPINLSNNPLNEDLESVNVGDIRGQYQSIFYNNPDTTGKVFGANNYRDLGNLVPWGNRIIQNSASLVLPGTFLRKQNHNLFNALAYNSKEYIKFKSLLVDTINNTPYTQRYDPSYLLDDALDQITASKTDTQPFFWSDMIPNKTP